MGINPSYSPLPLGSAYGSVVGALGVILGLIRRTVDGKGDRLEVPLGAALCDALVFNSMAVPDLPPRYLTMREMEIAERRARGDAMNMSYKQVKALLDPFYHTYTCKDKRPFYVVTPCHLQHQVRCLKALGIWDDMVALGLPTEDTNVYVESSHWKANMVLGTYPLTDPVWIERLKHAMETAFLKRTALEWEHIFASYKVPGGKTRTTKEWLLSEHANASGLVIERRSPHLHGAPMKEGGALVWHTRATVPSSSFQRADTKRFALASLRTGSGSTSSASLWLSGTKVVDLSNVIAGPTIGGMLARYGADVIKVDPTKPTYDALVTVYMGIPINAGKRSMLVDIKSMKGKEILHRLVQWADVVIVNQVASQLRSLGVDEASLKNINPHVILTHFDAFGGPYHGPRSNSVGYDDILQASTGIMSRFGGSLATPAEHAHLGTVDVVSGFSGCLATCLSIFKRLQTGVSDVARTSLAANAQHIQTPFMYHFDGIDSSVEAKEPRGPTATGESWLYRWYQTARPGRRNRVEEEMGPTHMESGHVFVACKKSGTGMFQRVISSLQRIGCTGLYDHGMVDDTRAMKLQAFILRLDMDAEDVAQMLRSKCGLEAIPLNSMSRLRESNISPSCVFGKRQQQPQTYHFHTVESHPIGSSVEMFSPCSLLSDRFGVSVMPSQPKYGEHTVSILQNVLQYTADEIKAMLSTNNVGEEWSRKYIPDGNTTLNPWENVKDEYQAFLAKVERLHLTDSKL